VKTYVYLYLDNQWCEVDDLNEIHTLKEMGMIVVQMGMDLPPTQQAFDNIFRKKFHDCCDTVVE